MNSFGIATVASVSLVCGAAHAGVNLIVNGDFEDNTAGGNVFNPDNATFNGLMNNVTAFGVREGIDIMTFGSGFGADPHSGSWKVTPASDAGGNTEAFSMDLSGPLTMNVSYDLDFYLERLAEGPFDNGKVEIGVSTSATDFGTLVYTSNDSTDGWSLESTMFVAPFNASFLTVRVQTIDDSWVGLDTFSLTEVPAPGAFGLFALAGLAARRRRRCS